MALRAGYKGIKKLLPGLKLFRPGTLGIDNDVLIPELNEIFSPRSDITTLQNNVIANTKLIKDTVGWSGKNKLPITLELLKANNTAGTWNGNVYTNAGTTFTIRTDSNGYVEDITVNASSVTASSNFSLLQKSQLQHLLNYVGKDFVLTGCPSGGSDSAYRLTAISLDGTDGSTSSDYGSGKNITIGNFTSFINDAYIVIRMFQGATIDNKVFKPMLRDADILDPTYEPYFGSTAVDWVSYEELTEKVQGIINAATNAADFAAFKTAIGNL